MLVSTSMFAGAEGKGKIVMKQILLLQMTSIEGLQQIMGKTYKKDL